MFMATLTDEIDMLLKSSEIGRVKGISLQDPQKIGNWLTFGDIISTREEGIVQNGQVHFQNNMTSDIILKTNADYNCLIYEYLAGLEMNRFIQMTGNSNFIQTYGLFFIRNSKYTGSRYLTITDTSGKSVFQYGEYIPYLMIESVGN